MRSPPQVTAGTVLGLHIDRLAPPKPSSVRKGMLTPTPGTPLEASPLLATTDY